MDVDKEKSNETFFYLKSYTQEINPHKNENSCSPKSTNLTKSKTIMVDRNNFRSIKLEQKSSQSVSSDSDVSSCVEKSIEREKKKRNIEESEGEENHLIEYNELKEKLVQALKELEKITLKIDENKKEIKEIKDMLDKIKKDKSQSQSDIVNLLANKESIEEIYENQIQLLTNDSNKSNNNNGSLKSNNNDNNFKIIIEDIKGCDITKFIEQSCKMADDILEKPEENIITLLKDIIKKAYNIFNSELSTSSFNKPEMIISNFFVRISLYISNQSLGKYSESDINIFLRYLLKSNTINKKIINLVKFVNKKYKEKKKKFKEEIDKLEHKIDKLINKKKILEKIIEELKHKLDIFENGEPKLLKNQGQKEFNNNLSATLNLFQDWLDNHNYNDDSSEENYKQNNNAGIKNHYIKASHSTKSYKNCFEEESSSSEDNNKDNIKFRENGNNHNENSIHEIINEECENNNNFCIRSKRNNNRYSNSKSNSNSNSSSKSHSNSSNIKGNNEKYKNNNIINNSKNNYENFSENEEKHKSNNIYKDKNDDINIVRNHNYYMNDTDNYKQVNDNIYTNNYTYEGGDLNMNLENDNNNKYDNIKTYSYKENNNINDSDEKDNHKINDSTNYLNINGNKASVSHLNKEMVISFQNIRPKTNKKKIENQENYEVIENNPRDNNNSGIINNQSVIMKKHFLNKKEENEKTPIYYENREGIDTNNKNKDIYLNENNNIELKLNNISKDNEHLNVYFKGNSNPKNDILQTHNYFDLNDPILNENSNSFPGVQNLENENKKICSPIISDVKDSNEIKISIYNNSKKNEENNGESLYSVQKQFDNVLENKDNNNNSNLISMKNDNQVYLCKNDEVNDYNSNFSNKINKKEEFNKIICSKYIKINQKNSENNNDSNIEKLTNKEQFLGKSSINKEFYVNSSDKKNNKNDKENKDDIKVKNDKCNIITKKANKILLEEKEEKSFQNNINPKIIKQLTNEGEQEQVDIVNCLEKNGSKKENQTYNEDRILSISQAKLISERKKKMKDLNRNNKIESRCIVYHKNLIKNNSSNDVNFSRQNDNLSLINNNIKDNKDKNIYLEEQNNKHILSENKILNNENKKINTDFVKKQKLKDNINSNNYLNNDDNIMRDKNNINNKYYSKNVETNKNNNIDKNIKNKIIFNNRNNNSNEFHNDKYCCSFGNNENNKEKDIDNNLIYINDSQLNNINKSNNLETNKNSNPLENRTKIINNRNIQKYNDDNFNKDNNNNINSIENNFILEKSQKKTDFFNDNNFNINESYTKKDTKNNEKNKSEVFPKIDIISENNIIEQKEIINQTQNNLFEDSNKLDNKTEDNKFSKNEKNLELNNNNNNNINKISTAELKNNRKNKGEKIKENIQINKIEENINQVDGLNSINDNKKDNSSNYKETKIQEIKNDEIFSNKHHNNNFPNKAIKEIKTNSINYDYKQVNNLEISKKDKNLDRKLENLINNNETFFDDCNNKINEEEKYLLPVQMSINKIFNKKVIKDNDTQLKNCNIIKEGEKNNFDRNNNIKNRKLKEETELLPVQIDNNNYHFKKINIINKKNNELKEKQQSNFPSKKINQNNNSELLKNDVLFNESYINKVNLKKINSNQYYNDDNYNSLELQRNEDKNKNLNFSENYSNEENNIMNINKENNLSFPNNEKTINLNDENSKNGLYKNLNNNSLCFIKNNANNRICNNNNKNLDNNFKIAKKENNNNFIFEKTLENNFIKENEPNNNNKIDKNIEYKNLNKNLKYIEEKNNDNISLISKNTKILYNQPNIINQENKNNLTKNNYGKNKNSFTNNINEIKENNNIRDKIENNINNENTNNNRNNNIKENNYNNEKNKKNSLYENESRKNNNPDDKKGGPSVNDTVEHPTKESNTFNKNNIIVNSNIQINRLKNKPNFEDNKNDNNTKKEEYIYKDQVKNNYLEENSSDNIEGNSEENKAKNNFSGKENDYILKKFNENYEKVINKDIFIESNNVKYEKKSEKNYNDKNLKKNVKYYQNNFEKKKNDINISNNKNNTNEEKDRNININKSNKFSKNYTNEIVRNIQSEKNDIINIEAKNRKNNKNGNININNCFDIVQDKLNIESENNKLKTNIIIEKENNKNELKEEKANNIIYSDKSNLKDYISLGNKYEKEINNEPEKDCMSNKIIENNSNSINIIRSEKNDEEKDKKIKDSNQYIKTEIYQKKEAEIILRNDKPKSSLNNKKEKIEKESVKTSQPNNKNNINNIPKNIKEDDNSFFINNNYKLKENNIIDDINYNSNKIEKRNNQNKFPVYLGKNQKCKKELKGEENIIKYQKNINNTNLEEKNEKTNTNKNTNGIKLNESHSNYNSYKETNQNDLIYLSKDQRKNNNYTGENKKDILFSKGEVIKSEMKNNILDINNEIEDMEYKIKKEIFCKEKQKANKIKKEMTPDLDSDTKNIDIGTTNIKNNLEYENKNIPISPKDEIKIETINSNCYSNYKNDNVSMNNLSNDFNGNIKENKINVNNIKKDIEKNNKDIKPENLDFDYDKNINKWKKKNDDYINENGYKINNFSFSNSGIRFKKYDKFLNSSNQINNNNNSEEAQKNENKNIINNECNGTILSKNIFIEPKPLVNENKNNIKGKNTIIEINSFNTKGKRNENNNIENVLYKSNKPKNKEKKEKNKINISKEIDYDTEQNLIKISDIKNSLSFLGSKKAVITEKKLDNYNINNRKNAKNMKENKFIICDNNISQNINEKNETDVRKTNSNMHIYQRQIINDNTSYIKNHKKMNICKENNIDYSIEKNVKIINLSYDNNNNEKERKFIINDNCISKEGFIENNPKKYTSNMIIHNLSYDIINNSQRAQNFTDTQQNKNNEIRSITLNNNNLSYTDSISYRNGNNISTENHFINGIENNETFYNGNNSNNNNKSLIEHNEKYSDSKSKSNTINNKDSNIVNKNNSIYSNKFQENNIYDNNEKENKNKNINSEIFRNINNSIKNNKGTCKLIYSNDISARNETNKPIVNGNKNLSDNNNRKNIISNLRENKKKYTFFHNNFNKSENFIEHTKNLLYDNGPGDYKNESQKRTNSNLDKSFNSSFLLKKPSSPQNQLNFTNNNALSELNTIGNNKFSNSSREKNNNNQINENNNLPFSNSKTNYSVQKIPSIFQNNNNNDNYNTYEQYNNTEIEINNEENESYRKEEIKTLFDKNWGNYSPRSGFELDNQLKIFTQGIMESFCYFKILDKDSTKFDPLDSCSINPVNLGYYEGYISIDVILGHLKIVSRRSPNNCGINTLKKKKLFNKIIQSNNSSLLENYSNDENNDLCLGIELKEIHGLNMKKNMQDIVKIHKTFLKYNSGSGLEYEDNNGRIKKRILSINKLIYMKEISAIPMEQNEKIKAALCNFFAFSLSFGRNSHNRVECIFINFEQFNIWYKCLETIVENNNKSNKSFISNRNLLLKKYDVDSHNRTLINGSFAKDNNYTKKNRGTREFNIKKKNK